MKLASAIILLGVSSVLLGIGVSMTVLTACESPPANDARAEDGARCIAACAARCAADALEAPTSASSTSAAPSSTPAAAPKRTAVPSSSSGRSPP